MKYHLYICEHITNGTFFDLMIDAEVVDAGDALISDFIARPDDYTITHRDTVEIDTNCGLPESWVSQ